MKKKSLNQSETIRWLVFSFLPEFMTLLYVIVRSIINPYFLNYFLITALFFSVFITIYTYLKAGLMVCSYFMLVKINNNETDDNKRQSKRNIFTLVMVMMNLVLLLLIIIPMHISMH